MKSRSYVLGALVLSLLITCLPIVASASGPETALARDHVQKSVRADREGEPLGDIVTSDGDPSDLLGGNDVKPRPVEQDGESSGDGRLIRLVSWLQYVITALNPLSQ